MATTTELKSTEDDPTIPYLIVCNYGSNVRGGLSDPTGMLIDVDCDYEECEEGERRPTSGARSS